MEALESRPEPSWDAARRRLFRRWSDELVVAVPFALAVVGFIASTLYCRRRTHRGARVALKMDALTGLLAVGLVLPVLGVLRRRRGGLEERLDELEAFAARVAHDVRSPLAPALLALQRMSSRIPSDDPLRGLVDRGARSLRTIERIVSGLLAFASAGARPKRGECASIRETLEAVLAEHADAAAQCSVELCFECDTDASTACAPGVLASILGNLVGNAIRYIGSSEERRVRVCARARARAARIEVSDTGPGLPVGAERCIFEPYVRMNRDGGGIGLGLATVKRLATAHGGACGVASGGTCGSTFWVELPLANHGS
jgi:signal transduction histidine kinase